MTNATKRLTNYLNYPSEIAKALNNIDSIKSFKYKNFFSIPKVKVTWQVGRFAYFFSQQQVSPLSFIGGKEGKLTFTINSKPVRGWILFDHPPMFDTLSDTKKWLNIVLSEKLTSVINSIEPNASKSRTSAKKVVESYFGVKVRK